MSSDKRPFLPYGRQTITEADIASVVEVLRSPFLTQGPIVPAFEQAVANKIDARYAVAVNSATSALHIACLALDLGPFSGTSREIRVPGQSLHPGEPRAQQSSIFWVLHVGPSLCNPFVLTISSTSLWGKLASAIAGKHFRSVKSITGCRGRRSHDYRK